MKRLIRERQPTKPECNGLTMVHPVAIAGLLSAFNMLAGSFDITSIDHHLPNYYRILALITVGMALGFLSLILEKIAHFYIHRKH